ncbi:YrrS family protein [Bacillus sp. JJ1764]|uniref:YrrS family protein n=1 Tax=Bacillus sp. JJ1764 TaxID=3122964 RepID=UPI002FFEA731
MKNEANQNSRSDYRAKRKKTNYILNGLIVLVLVLIMIVAYNIFVSDNDHASSTNHETSKTVQKETTTKKDSNKVPTTTKEKNSSNDSEKVKDDQEDQDTTTGTADDSQAVSTDGGSTANVIKTIENPSWKPVGTSQTGEHSPVYDTTSADWQEMISALSYATGIDQSNMSVYWLGRDKSTSNASVGTVYSKDKQQKYRVFIKWVDGEGWMPTKVEELAELER